MNGELKKYLYISVSIFISLACALLLFFAMFRIEDFVAQMKGYINIIMPFIWGGVIAYLLAPICNYIENVISNPMEKMKKDKEKADKLTAGIAILLSVVLALCAFFSLVSLVLPQVWESIITIVEGLPSNIERFLAWGSKILSENPELMAQFESVYFEYVEQIETWISTDFLAFAQTFIEDVYNKVFEAVGVVTNIGLGVIVSIYLLSSRGLFIAQFKKASYGILGENKGNLLMHELRYANQVFGGFIRGKLLDSLIIGLICFIACTIMNLPYTELISVIIGVTNIIPFFGPFIGAIPCTIFVLTVSPIQAVYFVIFIIVLQQFDGNILGPKILGETTGVSGFWVLFSILFFGGLWGFIGMIVGVPLFAVIYSISSRLITRRLRLNRLPIETETYKNLDTISNGVVITLKDDK